MGEPPGRVIGGRYCVPVCSGGHRSFSSTSVKLNVTAGYGVSTGRERDEVKEERVVELERGERRT